MKVTESELYDLIDTCNKNINSGNTNAAGSYEGVRDALTWVLEETAKPFIGRE